MLMVMMGIESPKHSVRLPKHNIYKLRMYLRHPRFPFPIIVYLTVKTLGCICEEIMAAWSIQPKCEEM